MSNKILHHLTTPGVSAEYWSPSMKALGGCVNAVEKYPPILWLDAFKSSVWFGRKRDRYLIAWTHDATTNHNAHDSRLANDYTLGGASKYRSHETGLELIDLRAWVAQSRELDD